MKSDSAILSEKGQITIPKGVRDQLGLRPGQVLEFRVQRGQLIGEKKSETSDALTEVIGLLRGKVKNVDDYLDRVRGPRPS